MIRKVVVIAAIALVALVLAACGSAATPTPTAMPTVEATAEPTMQPTEIMTPTVVMTPTVSITPTVSVTSTVSVTPTVSMTPTVSVTATVAVSPTVVASSGDELNFELVPSSSKARYRVREQLLNRDLPNDAVGETSNVTGTIVVDVNGKIVPTKSTFVVDLSTLQSDQSRRDNFLRNNTLQTDKFPKATFVVTEAKGLPSPLPASGNGTFELTGDLTIRDVTKPVTWQVTLQRDGEKLTGTAKLAFKFADFSLEQPRVPVVLSVQDNIQLELDFVLQEAK